jgi:hypothetical protein
VLPNCTNNRTFRTMRPHFVTVIAHLSTSREASRAVEKHVPIPHGQLCSLRPVPILTRLGVLYRRPCRMSSYSTGSGAHDCAHLSMSRCPPTAANAHVCSSHEQCCSCDHLSISRCPPRAASKHMLASHGQPCFRAYLRTSTCPPAAAEPHVLSVHELPSAMAHTRSSMDPQNALTFIRNPSANLAPGRPKDITVARHSLPTRTNSVRAMGSNARSMKRSRTSGWQFLAQLVEQRKRVAPAGAAPAVECHFRSQGFPPSSLRWRRFSAAA